MKVSYFIAGILIVIPMVVLAIIPLYNHVNPTFIGMPFFYWFQTLFLIISSVMYVAASILIAKAKGGGK